MSLWVPYSLCRGGQRPVLELGTLFWPPVYGRVEENTCKRSLGECKSNFPVENATPAPRRGSHLDRLDSLITPTGTTIVWSSLEFLVPVQRLQRLVRRTWMYHLEIMDLSCHGWATPKGSKKTPSLEASISYLDIYPRLILVLHREERIRSFLQIKFKWKWLKLSEVRKNAESHQQ